MYPEFMQDIVRMNKMFELPVNKSIQLDKDLATKLYKLHNTLTDEVDELLEIIEEIIEDVDLPIQPQITIDHYVALADLLGDMIVYCASEAFKHGIPLDEVLRAIMASQWSKLGPNGEVIKDENGKFLKGENYRPPEEHIKTILQANIRSVLCTMVDSSTNSDIINDINKSILSNFTADDIINEDYNDRN